MRDQFSEIIEKAQRGAAKVDEDGVIVLFYDRPVQNNFKSKEQGRPVYEDQIYVKVVAYGQTHSTVDRRKKDLDEEKWPTAWNAYLSRDKKDILGTPIEEWTEISRSRAAELRHINVLSVEQLAKVADANLGNLGPDGMGLRERARKFLAGQDKKDVELDELREQVAALTASVDELKAAQAKPRKKPGPKPKVTADEPSDDSSRHAA